MTNVINIEQCEGQSLDIEVTSNDRGPQGVKGATFTPAVAENGDISWTNDGGLQNPQTTNIKGPKGETGKTGTTFTPTVDFGGNISWTNDGGKENPLTRNIKGPRGRDGVIQYTAGTGIDITNNVISVTSASSVAWGAITGDIKDQTDLSNSLSAIENDIDNLQIDINGINGKIPSQATTTNKLADKDFVNSSIATNTATFRGTYNSVAELPTSGITNNDYAFVISVDEHGNTLYNRYKYNGTTWAFEYALNNSSFTAAQWSTINSGMVATDKTKLDNLATVAISGSYNDLSNKPSLGSLAAKNTVATNDIDNAAVTTDKIADGAITAAKIPNSTITAEKLSPSMSSCITAVGSGGFITCSNGDKVRFDRTFGNSLRGNFTINGYDIVVGAGISKIRVSANVYCYNAASGYAFFKIYKNSSYNFASTNPIGNYYGTVVFSPIIISVSEGDRICIKNEGNLLEVNPSESYITVEAIG